jgi:hypothetical protein
VTRPEKSRQKRTTLCLQNTKHKSGTV